MLAPTWNVLCAPAIILLYATLEHTIRSGDSVRLTRRKSYSFHRHVFCMIIHTHIRENFSTRPVYKYNLFRPSPVASVAVVYHACPTMVDVLPAVFIYGSLFSKERARTHMHSVQRTEAARVKGVASLFRYVWLKYIA